MSMTSADGDVVLDLLIGRSGLSPTDSDRDALTTALGTAAEHRALVHAVTAARYAEPGLVFAARTEKTITP